MKINQYNIFNTERSPKVTSKEAPLLKLLKNLQLVGAKFFLFTVKPIARKTKVLNKFTPRVRREVYHKCLKM